MLWLQPHSQYSKVRKFSIKKRGNKPDHPGFAFVEKLHSNQSHAQALWKRGILVFLTSMRHQVKPDEPLVRSEGLSA